MIEKNKRRSIFDVVAEARAAGEDLDDAEIYRRAGLDPNDFYHGEEAGERFAVGMKAITKQPLTPEEEAIRKDIVRTMDEGIRKSGYAPPAKVGGKWTDNE